MKFKHFTLTIVSALAVAAICSCSGDETPDSPLVGKWRCPINCSHGVNDRVYDLRNAGKGNIQYHDCAENGSKKHDFTWTATADTLTLKYASTGDEFSYSYALIEGVTDTLVLTNSTAKDGYKVSKYVR